MIKPEHTESDFFFEAVTLYEDDEKTVARITLRGLNARTINRSSTTTYEVESGTGTMEIDGVFHDLSEGVTLVVPNGRPYQDEGDLVMIATSVPPFDPARIYYV